MYTGLNASNPKLCPACDSLTHSLTRVKSRATSVAKKRESSEFNHRNDEQVQSSFEGSNLDPKNFKTKIGGCGAWEQLVSLNHDRRKILETGCFEPSIVFM